MSFLFQAVSKFIWSNQKDSNSSGQLLQLQGSFYDELRSQWHCLMNDAVATVVRVGDQHQFAIQIDSVGSEPAAKALQFHLTDKLRLHAAEGPCGMGIAWTEGNNVYLFEVENSQSNMLPQFKRLCCECTFQYLYKRSHEGAPESQVMQFCDESKVISAPSQLIRPAFTPSTAAPQRPPSQVPKPSGKVVQSALGELFMDMWDEEKLNSAASEPVFKSVDSDATIQIIDTSVGKKLSYNLVVLDKQGGVSISQELNTDMNAQFARRSLIWCAVSADGLYWWSFRFNDADDEPHFREAFARSLYEAKSQIPFAKTKAEDRKYITDVLAVGADSDDERSDDDMDVEELQDEDVDADEMDVEDAEEKSGVKNSNLAVGTVKDRSYVVRGSRLGVFKHDGSGLKYTTTIKNIASPSSKDVFSPKKVYLHKSDTNMLMLNPSDLTSVYKMDLERGQVVEEWKTPGGGEMKVFDLVSETKTAQADGSSTVVALNNCGFFVMDDRTKDKVVNSRNFQYNSDKLKFRCAATTQEGHLALGTAAGDIRLYNAQSLAGGGKAAIGIDIPKPKAKTNLPGCGDPIIGMDTTSNGEWLLATCKYYIMVVHLTAENGANAFTKSLGAAKPSPVILRLRREHVTLVGGNVSFTPARFNTGGAETSIVTSTGPFVITWSFERVKRGQLDVYTIHKYEQDVVAEGFRYGQDRSLVVTLPDDVKLSHKVVVGK